MPRTTDNLDPCKITVTAMYGGMAGYRIQQYAKNYNVSANVASKEIMLEGLKALGMLPREYSLTDMRKGK